MTIANVALSNTFNQFRTTTNEVITEVNKLSDGTATLVIDSITANTFVGVSSDLNISANSGSDTVSLVTETLRIVGTNGISTSVATSSNTINVNLDTSGVTAGTYGSTTQIPQIVIDAQGRVTSASNSTISTDLSISGNTGTDTITLGTDTLGFRGTNGITAAVTSNTVTMQLGNSGVTAGAYGSSSQVPQIIIDDQGRITSAANVSVAGVSAFNYHSSNANFQILTSAGGSLTASIGQDLGTSANVTFQHLVVSGNLTVTGTTTTISANTLAITDNLIYLNDDSSNTNVDLGFAGNYNDGTYRHAGLFRDADDGVWKFFDRYTPEPDASANLDTSHVSFTFAALKAGDITSNSIFYGNGSGLTSIPNSATTASSSNGASTIVSRSSAGGIGIGFFDETVTAVTLSGGNTAIDWNLGAVWNVTLTANSTIYFTNPPSSNRARTVTLFITNSGASQKALTVTGARYTDGVAPVLSSAASAVDAISFTTIDGGLNYYGSFILAALA